ncbi:diguanylate cyclase [bacterium]|nr:MAG: diguanylate cyclase [bacterium]
MDQFHLPRPTDSRTRRQDRTVEDRKWRLHPGAVFTALFCGTFALWAIFGGASEATRLVVTDWLSPLTAIAATIWSLWDLPTRIREYRRGESIGRAGWSAMFLSASVGSFALGASIWSYHELVLHVAAFPSWADAGYFSSFVFLIAGILLLPTRKMPAMARWRTLLDSFIVTAALVTVSWLFLLGPTILDSKGTLLAKVLAPYYPIMDLAMLFCITVVAGSAQDRAYARVRNLLYTGVLAYVAADVVFAYTNFQGTYKTGYPFDTGWLVANLTIGQAALVLRKRQHQIAAESNSSEEPDEIRPPSFWRNLLPYAFVPGIVVLLDYVSDERIPGELAIGAHVGCGVLLALIFLRQVLATAETSRVYRFLHDAYRELQAVATTDGMTGLPNHRSFQERLRKSANDTQEAGQPLALLLIDVDRFKQYNDNFGHPAGDEALRIVARIIRESLRDSDLPARYGGEEFAAILPNTDAEGAGVVAERIRAACEAEPFPCRAVTLSVGVAVRAGDADPSGLIERADQALYLAKHRGRNRVVLAEGGASAGMREEISMPNGWSLHESRNVGIDRIGEVGHEEPSGPLLKVLLAMLNLKDGEVERHSDRVMRYSLRLAEEALALGAVSISEDEMTDLHLGALLHDIGKVGVPDAVLHKPGALSEEEWAIVRRHPIQGAEILSDIPALSGAVPVVRWHHERWDGTGYPDGLAAEAIPLGARIFALADTLDAMWSDRPYRRAMDYLSIRAEVMRMSGLQFDPVLAAAFLNVPEGDWERIRGTAQDLPKAA